MTDTDNWTISSIDRHYELMMDFGWQLYSSLNGSMARFIGEQALYDLTEHILTTHQKHYFLEGLNRLNLDRELTRRFECAFALLFERTLQAEQLWFYAFPLHPNLETR